MAACSPPASSARRHCSTWCRRRTRRHNPFDADAGPAGRFAHPAFRPGSHSAPCRCGCRSAPKTRCGSSWLLLHMLRGSRHCLGPAQSPRHHAAATEPDCLPRKPAFRSKARAMDKFSPRSCSRSRRSGRERPWMDKFSSSAGHGRRRFAGRARSRNQAAPSRGNPGRTRSRRTAAAGHRSGRQRPVPGPEALRRKPYRQKRPFVGRHPGALGEPIDNLISI